MIIEQAFVDKSIKWALYEEWATCLATFDIIYSMNEYDFDVRGLSERSW